jgi:PAS domain S-box-containing protein
MLVLLVLVALAYYSVSISQKSLKESVGNSSIFLAEEILNRIEQNIFLKVEELQKYSKGSLLQKTVLESNREFEKLNSIEEYINRKDREWISASKDEITPFMKNMISDELSDDLREEFIKFYKKKYGYDVFEVVSVANRYGANVAQTGKTFDYRQDDEEWWQVAKERDFYVSDVECGEIIETHGITIGVRIDDKKGNFTGMMRARVGAKEIIREAEISTKKYETTGIKLITRNGKLIYETRAFKFLEDVSEKEFFKKIKGESGFFIAKEGGRERLFSYVQSKGYRSFEGHEWIFVVGHDTGEVLRPAFVLRNSMMVVSLILITLAISIAFLMSRSITKPIAKLSKGAEIVGKGNLEHRVELKTQDEIGELAVAFNRMTEKRQGAEEALRESEERFRKLFEQSNDAVLIHKFGRIIDVNERTCEMLGYSEDQLLTMSIEDLHPEKNRTESRRRVSTVHVGESILFETQFMKSDGTMVDVEVSSRVIDQEKGIIQGIARNISKRKRLEAQLQRAQKMEAIGTLAGGVAHDLNNILAGLVSYPELLLLEIPEESPLRNPILTIQKSGEKAAAIVQDLLTLARRGVAVTEVVNLNHIISEYVKSPEHERLISFHPNVHVRTDLETDLLNILASPAHMSKTIMNLVSNAAEAMPDGGEIYISTQNRYIDRTIRGYDNVEEGDYITLTVSDAGVGIHKKDRERIFEPFYTKKVMGRSGTGLGMAVVWGTVKDHKGYIDIQSAKGKGTTFTLYFPVTRKKVGKDKSLLAIEDYMGKGESILVVDDVEEQREIASKILKKLGYSVKSVSSGEEAIDYLKDNSADLLLLDMIMDPGIDGLETYKRILEFHPKQKAIIVSGFSETRRVKEAQRLGARAYVKKPFLLEIIGIAVRDELDKK